MAEIEGQATMVNQGSEQAGVVQIIWILKSREMTIYQCLWVE